MSRYYALTINTRTRGRGAPGPTSYNRSLDTLEKTYGVTIFPRMFETAPRTGKLHVHCLVTQDSAASLIESMVGQKNHNIDFQEVNSKQAWLNYISKEAKKPIKRIV